MTALILKARRFVAMIAPSLQAIHRRFLQALDAVAEARMRKAEREINHYRRLMHVDHSPSAMTIRANR